MKNLKKIAFVLSMIMFSICAVSIAYANTIEQGDWIKLYNGTYGTTNGGEFIVKSSDTKDGAYVTQDDTTFCLETNEYFYYGEPLYVDNISKNAVNGGSGGPDPDPIDKRTAYLYYNFVMEQLGTLTSGAWVYNDSGINALQLAIWYIEQEILGSNNYLVTLANSASEADLNIAYASVWVLNLTDGNLTKKQDQLTYIPVPEPATLLLLGFGLVGLAGIKRKFNK